MSQSPRRILLVEFFSRGGLLHYSLQLARSLAAEAASGVDIVLLTAKHPEVAVAPVGVRMLTCLDTWDPHYQPRHLPRRLVRALRALRYAWVWTQVVRVVRRERPNLILLSDLEHRCDAWFVYLLQCWCRRQQPRAALADVWHNVEAFERDSNRLQRHLPWREHTARAFDTVFVHGTTLQAQFTRLTGRDACAIPHGDQVWFAEQAGPQPDLDQRFQLPPGRPLAMLFGTLNTYKGVDVLLQALTTLPAPSRPMLLIAGRPTTASQWEAWRRFTQQHHLTDWVRWDRRYVPSAEIAWYFRRADWVVLPYRAASQSGVGHLALTFGKPLLVTATGGLPELVDGNGLVVAPGDPAALAQAMKHMAADAALRQQWGRRSAELARTRHAWPPIARTVLAAAAPGMLLPAQPIATNAASRSSSIASGTGIRTQKRVR
ncbi:MAG: glycosyltransferase [Terriglobales bacterium]